MMSHNEMLDYIVDDMKTWDRQDLLEYAQLRRYKNLLNLSEDHIKALYNELVEENETNS